MSEPHVHAFTPWVDFRHAPCGPYPSHTRFMLLFCPGCGIWDVWPRENYELCTPEFRALLERLATEATGFLVAHEPGPDVSHETFSERSEN